MCRGKSLDAREKLHCYFFFFKRQNLDTFFSFPQGILPLLGNIAVIKHNPD